MDLLEFVYVRIGELYNITAPVGRFRVARTIIDCGFKLHLLNVMRSD